MADNDQVDQDAIAAQWEASLDSEDPAEAAKVTRAEFLPNRPLVCVSLRRVRLKPAALLAGQFVSEAVLRTDPGA